MSMRDADATDISRTGFGPIARDDAIGYAWLNRPEQQSLDALGFAKADADDNREVRPQFPGHNSP
jgi:hypothetical protein